MFLLDRGGFRHLRRSRDSLTPKSPGTIAPLRSNNRQSALPGRGLRPFLMDLAQMAPRFAYALIAAVAVLAATPIATSAADEPVASAAIPPPLPAAPRFPTNTPP